MKKLFVLLLVAILSYNCESESSDTNKTNTSISEGNEQSKDQDTDPPSNTENPIEQPIPPVVDDSNGEGNEDDNDQDKHLNWLRLNSSILFNENGDEYSKTLFQYDSEGREAGIESYINGKLFSKAIDYSYNGNELTHYTATYNKEGEITSRSKTIKNFKTNWLRLNLLILFHENGDEHSKTLFQYDSEGREVGIESYLNGKLFSKGRDYTYNGNELTYFTDSYNEEGEITSRSKTIKNFKDNWLRLNSLIMFHENGDEHSKTLFQYDSEGREVGIEFYLNGKLSSKGRGYSYNGNELTYYTDSYNENGKVTLTTKGIKNYFNKN